MMDKFQNKYRIPSARAQWWDYANAGAYFITICTAHRVHYFGEIVRHDVETRFIASQLNASQLNASQLNAPQLNAPQLSAPQLSASQLSASQLNASQLSTSQLSASQLNASQLNASQLNASQLNASLPGQIAQKYWHAIPAQFPFIELGAFVVMPNHIHGILIINDVVNANVETRLIASLQQTEQTEQKTGGFAGIKNPMLNNNISRVVRWYKGVCTFEMRKLHADFQWQSRFHDHIIRNDDEYQRIVNYINANPENWEQDKFYKSEEL